MDEPDDSSALVRRAEQWTLVLGLAAGLFAAIYWGWRIGGGVAAGALLSWINLRWLKEGIVGLTGSSEAEENSSAKRAKRGVWLRFLGRYVLIAAGVCVILFGLHWPGIALVAGLFAAVAGVLAALISHLLFGIRRT